MDILSLRIKELRKEKNLTQRQLAELLKTTDDSIFSWEKGRSQPSIDVIRKLCIFFDVSADYLLGLEDETGAKTYIRDSFNNFTNTGTIKF